LTVFFRPVLPEHFVRRVLIDVEGEMGRNGTEIQRLQKRQAEIRGPLEYFRAMAKWYDEHPAQGQAPDIVTQRVSGAEPLENKQ